MIMDGCHNPQGIEASLSEIKHGLEDLEDIVLVYGTSKTIEDRNI